MGKLMDFRSLVPKVPFFSKNLWYDKTQSYQGFAGCLNQKTKIFTIVANESCTQIYITIEIEKKVVTNWKGELDGLLQHYS